MKYIKGFDGLRAISIIMVICTHLGLLDGVSEHTYLGSRLLNIFSGFTGVNIFFVLSGFLITRILFTEKQSSGTINLKHFFFRRFLRLLPPLFVFFIAAGLFMSADLIERSYAGLFFAIFYVYDFIPNKFYTSELGHLWSLAVEEQFYFIWPFVVYFFSGRRIVVIASLIIGLCIVAQQYLPAATLHLKGKTFLINDLFKIRRWFLPAAAPIMIGALVSYIIIDNKYRLKLNRLFSFDHLHLVGIGLFLSPFILSYPLLEFCYLPQSLGIAFILIWINYHQQSFFVSALELKVFSYIGKISYGLYIYHGLFLRTGPGGTLRMQQFPVNLLLTIIITIVSYHLYERPVMKLKSRFV